MNCNSAIKGTIIMCQEIPTPEKIQNMIIITHEIKKLTRPLKATDIGNISLGKYTFFNIPALL